MNSLGAGTIVDRYEIDGILGRGGMAVVYRARHRQLGTPCALKVLMGAAGAVHTRLVQEGKIQAALVHPNIVRVFDVVEVDGAPGLVMELVNGPSLEALLAKHALSLEQADEIAQGIIAGVGAAHALGLVHRDLKPANVLMQLTAQGPVPKVADFGLAKVVLGDQGGDSATATRSGLPMGTPAYMAPEQIRDAKGVDLRADVFALGAMLYQMVTGKRAFADDDILNLYIAIAAGNYPPVRELRPDLPERMERAIVGALRTNRDERIQDCATLLATWRGLDATAGGAARIWSIDLLGEITEESKAKPANATTGPDDFSIETGEAGRETHTLGSKASAPAVAAAVAAMPKVVSKASWSLENPEAPAEAGAGSASAGGVGAAAGPGAGKASRGIGRVVGAVGVLMAAALAIFFGVVPKPESAVTPPTPVPVAETPGQPEPAASVPAAQPPALTSPDPTQAAPVSPVTGAPAAPAPKLAPALPRAAAPPPKAAAVPTEMPLPAAPAALPTPAEAPAVVQPPAPAPAPSPETAPPNLARVTVSGDVDSVWLQGTNGNFRLPANVQPGTYKVQAYFTEGKPTVVTEITVLAGSTRALKCVKGALTCR